MVGGRRAFGFGRRRDRFDLLPARTRGVTPAGERQVQLELGWRSRCGHETSERVALSFTPLRGPFGPSPGAPACRVGGGRAFTLPPSARSNGSCGFPASRFPVWSSPLTGDDDPPASPGGLRVSSMPAQGVFRFANLSALPPCTHPLVARRRCHTARGLPPPVDLLDPTGVAARPAAIRGLLL